MAEAPTIDAPVPAPAAPAAPAAPTPAPAGIIDGATEAPPAGIIDGAVAPEPAAGEKPSSEGEKPAAETKPAVVPEAYEPFSLPEGITLDEEAAGVFATTAKELALDQAGAQKLVDIAAGMVQRQAAAIQQQVEERNAAWAAAAVADPTLNVQSKEVLRNIARARDRFASAELTKFMQDNGLNSHPEFVRLFSKIGAAISDDSFVSTGKAVPQPAPFFDHPTSRAKG